MDPTTLDTLRPYGLAVAGIMAMSLICGLALLGLMYRRLKQLNIPADADFSETLRAVPLFLVVAIDLLDLGLDILAVPLVWVLLDRLGLRALRNVSTIEAAIPFTQPVPTLTLSWLAVRLFR